MSDAHDPDAFSNPYAAPEADLGPTIPAPGADEEAERLRQHYIAHEASVRSVGWLNYLGGAVFVLAGLFAVAFGTGMIPPPEGRELDPEGGGALLVGVGLFCLAWAGLAFAIGTGLRRLRPWARWAETAVVGLNAIGCLVGPNAIGLIVSLFILYLMLSSRSAVVFSDEYRDVIARTPHIRYKTSPVVKFFLYLLLGVLALAVLSAILAAIWRR